jgi:phosphocarrier protein HPr
MLKKKLSVTNKLGLHARASMKLINLACRFESDIYLQIAENKADAKDILAVMSLGAAKGAEIEISVSGADEEEALNKISELFLNRFGESE